MGTPLVRRAAPRTGQAACAGETGPFDQLRAPSRSAFAPACDGGSPPGEDRAPCGTGLTSGKGAAGADGPGAPRHPCRPARLPGRHSSRPLVLRPVAHADPPGVDCRSDAPAFLLYRALLALWKWDCLKPRTAPRPLSTRRLLEAVRACSLCTDHLPLGPRPVLQFSSAATLLVAGQAPGSRVHASGVPFQDASGDRLREWLGLDADTFYDARRVAILPMGFCYPGTGRSGDFPPRPECAAAWRAQLMARLTNVKLVLVIGQYAQDWHLAGRQKPSVTETVLAWRDYWPAALPLPHPSPRNNAWLKRNPWFSEQVLPRLRRRVRELLP
jgi:uracil-DNA glycosylase